MALFARQLSRIALLLARTNDAARFASECDRLAALINEKRWDPERRFYFDLKTDGHRAPVKTIAAYWTLLAGVASREQAAELVAQLRNPATFGRSHRVPTLAADESGYNSAGGYWCGAVWAPTDMMVLRGLENYAYPDLAREIALEHLTRVSELARQTGTIWENYAPDSIAPGKPAKKDFVGWSGIGPILFLLEYGVGLKPDAPANKLEWDLRSNQRVGCERYRFNGHTIDLVATPTGNGQSWEVKVHSNGAFTLELKTPQVAKTCSVVVGTNRYSLP